MRGVALSLLVMGLSLVSILIAYESFGHLGPKFSADLLVKQQTVLRKQYGLPPRPVITNDSLLLVPPSLRIYPKQAIFIMSNIRGYFLLSK